ncbi:CLUMA_CG017064, isoform A [Clunio marinus]|uniref:CLUMA_CG017064, isoform A n=1 Tax=Clunio marinus TaxID=568069 RepID=A0A1J1IUT3_9DIPT|nr:CLUMA_CG017064, isoform A [Clunio marinus]
MKWERERVEADEQTLDDLKKMQNKGFKSRLAAGVKNAFGGFFDLVLDLGKDQQAMLQNKRKTFTFWS